MSASDFKRWKACERKAAYETQDAAEQKGQETYRCRYCGKWHRTAGVSKLLSVVRRSPKFNTMKPLLTIAIAAILMGCEKEAELQIGKKQLEETIDVVASYSYARGFHDAMMRESYTRGKSNNAQTIRSIYELTIIP